MTCMDPQLSPLAGPVAAPTEGPSTVRLMKFAATFGAGGTERQFVNLALALESSNFEVSFGCLRRSGRFLDELEAQGVRVFDYGVCTFKHPQALSAQLRLARDIRQLGIDVVHTYNFYANVFAIPAARLAGARVVASIRDMGPYLSPTQRRVQRWVCKLADRIAVNANAIRDWLIADGYDPNRIVVIPNGIDISRFKRRKPAGKLHSELGLPAGAPLIGVVSRLTRLKGLEDFLRASAIVSRRFPGAYFLIVGESLTVRGRSLERDTSYPDELARLAEQLGVRDRVVFVGFRSDVEQILPELTVSVLPSLSEGLSNVLLESMASETPVVATRVGDAVEAVQDHENGLLVEPGDSDSLAEAICRVLESPVLAARFKHAARRSVADRFSMERMVDSTKRLYESLLQ